MSRLIKVLTSTHLLNAEHILISVEIVEKFLILELLFKTL